jgi:hypothetical protein
MPQWRMQLTSGSFQEPSNTPTLGVNRSAHLRYGIATFNSRIPRLCTELYPNISGIEPWNNLLYQKSRHMRGTNARTTPTR